MYMCGIVGYVGEKYSVPVLIEGLKKLEYRGYDSAGVAVVDKGKLKLVKCKGRLATLEEKLKNDTPDGFVGIGHTRWATHGEPNDINSHPHLSFSRKIAVVHNGIIENHDKLKEILQRNGYRFVSETDTEVIAHLIEYNYSNDLLQAVIKSLKMIEGSYALGVLCSEHAEKFIAARKGSPLVAGMGRGENYIASDIPAILKHTRDIYILEDNEIAVLDKDSVKIYNTGGREIKKNIYHVDWDMEAAEKAGYEHFMLKEIHEEPKVLKETIGSGIKDGQIVFDKFDLTRSELNSLRMIHIVACGTAYHAGVVARYMLEKYTRIPVQVDVASEFRYRKPIVGPQDLVIIISQSGETLDTLMALREASKRGAKVVSIVNVVGSSIARESDNVLYTRAGPEIAVASTKAYNSQLAVLYMLTLFLAGKSGRINRKEYETLVHEISGIPDIIKDILTMKEHIRKFAKRYYNAKSIFYIGRGLDYALSMEGSLKLKEISYIHSEAYAGGELKHGTIALIEKGTPVVCPVTQNDLYGKMVGNIREVKARGAEVLAVTQKSNTEVNRIADMVINIPDINPVLAPVAAVTPLQLFAYYVAVEKGCDVDKPRNLAKSVTVE